MVRDTTLSDDMRQALEQTTAAMDHYRVSYALIGGMATSYRSQPRFTKDIDFLVKVPQLVLAPLLEDLLRRGFEFDTIATIGEWTQHHMVALSYHGIRIDFLKPLIPAYLHILDRATEETWLDRPLRGRSNPAQTPCLSQPGPDRHRKPRCRKPRHARSGLDHGGMANTRRTRRPTDASSVRIGWRI